MTNDLSEKSEPDGVNTVEACVKKFLPKTDWLPAGGSAHYGPN